MDARELLRSWPEWSHAGAARVMESPAWFLSVRYEGTAAQMRRCEEVAAPFAESSLSLDVRLDEAPHALTLALSPRFPDLWKLREKLSALPREVLLALVEKECGSFFQFLEDTFHGLFALVGADATGPVASTGIGAAAFHVALPENPLSFALDLTPEMKVSLGDLEHLDVTHASIRSLTTAAYARYATLAFTEEEAACLTPGDFLLWGDGTPGWVRELPADDAVQVVAPEKGTLTFAQLADGSLPPLPSVTTYSLYRRGKLLATAEEAKVGEARALKIRAL